MSDVLLLTDRAALSLGYDIGSEASEYIMRNEIRQHTFPEIKRELMTRHLYADIDIVVKFRTQTLLHILGMISLYVKMKMEKDRY